MRPLLAILSLAGLAACGAGTAPAPCSPTDPAAVASVLSGVNAQRAAAGLPPVRHDPRLQAAAENQACHMARIDTMTHDGARSDLAGRLKTAGYPVSLASENIAAGAKTPESALTSWAGSPPHRANMLAPQAAHMGIARAESPDSGTVYWAAVFGKNP